MDVSRSDTARQQYYEEDQFNKYVAQRKQQQADELTALDEEHKKNLENLAKTYKKDETDVDHDYRVELKRTVDMNEEKIAALQKDYEQQIKDVKAGHDKEFDKIGERERKRIEAYKKNQDVNMTKLHDHYIATEAEMAKNYES